MKLCCQKVLAITVIFFIFACPAGADTADRISAGKDHTILVTDEAKFSSADIHNLGKSKKADINVIAHPRCFSASDEATCWARNGVSKTLKNDLISIFIL